MVANSDRTRLPLSKYRKKRDFNVTPEPAPHAGGPSAEGQHLSFVVQKHWSGRLHYDFRLELDGVLLSWAVPKGPCYDPQEKRMAIHVEDHPIGYASFQGIIPPKQYGAGKVIVWDHGTWEPVGDPREGIQTGKLVFQLHGEKLAGRWELVRISKSEDKQDQWMLFKKRDEWARSLAEYDVVKALPDSVVDKPLGPIEEREPKSNPRPSLGVEPEADLTLAVATTLPATLEPQLATPAASLPKGNGWIVETKFDGYRLLARVDKGRVKLFTRGGHDWTSKLKTLAAELKDLSASSAWLDGEIVVLKDGLPDFNALQNAIDAARGESIVYFLFDLIYLDGKDLRKVPLSSRRALLARLVGEPGERIRISEHFDAPPTQVFKAACDLGLEGLMFKRHDAPYVSTRTQTWLKAKCTLRQEFVICGFTNRAGAPQEVGSLLLAYHDDDKLRHAGSVGTGWDAKTARDLWARLKALEVPSPSFDPKAVKPRRWSRRTVGSEHWVQPVLVAEVAFAEWTADGLVRQASFKGLRTDKPASGITREAAKTAASAPAPSAVKVTHPERVIDPSTGMTKLDLVRYYESVADWMLPHLKDRPLSLLRAPNGIIEELFFQKHPESKMPGLKEHDPTLWPGHGALLTVDNMDALVSAAQMNVVEFHTWNSTVGRLDRPDRVIFDLDPGEDLKWSHMQEAALLVHTLLTELGLKAWPKTSGGKGLHVVVPLAPRLDYDTVKGFARTFVVHIAKSIPQRFSAVPGPANRKGKVFVDYLRNGMGQTTVAAFSARARPGLGVSMPVTWEQLMSLKSGAQWTVATAREYLSFQTGDPWAEFWSTSQTLTSAMKRLI
ncbi:DNA ligase D [Cupriavidus sp. IDO]|uniref:DNA ligase D n=1 Tax=Cupriavidus sp. IDO TaxID=1539142 RepID=UPI0005793C73|nr:DNA ligase D [Cupriavidus sp. IDO]KWR91256.1 ATP-dependent DNA ligase [Cupriavidus sp. IDO]